MAGSTPANAACVPHAPAAATSDTFTGDDGCNPRPEQAAAQTEMVCTLDSAGPNSVPPSSVDGGDDAPAAATAAAPAALCALLPHDAPAADAEAVADVHAAADNADNGSQARKPPKALRVHFAPLPPSKELWLQQLRAMPPEGKARFLRRLQSVGRKVWCMWRQRSRRRNNAALNEQQQEEDQQDDQQQQQHHFQLLGLKRDRQQAVAESSSDDEELEAFGSPAKKGHAATGPSATTDGACITYTAMHSESSRSIGGGPQPMVLG